MTALEIASLEDALRVAGQLVDETEKKKLAEKIFPPLAKSVATNQNIAVVQDDLSLQAWLTLHSPYKYTWFCAGIGTGKSYILARYMLRRIIENWQTVGLVAANTNTQLTQSTLPHLFTLLNEAGLERDKDYVVNKKPPASWGARPLFERGYENVISIRVGKNKVAHLLTRTLESWTNIRGVTIGWAVLDEIADTREAAWSEITERLRCKLSHFLQIIVGGMPALPGDNWTWEEFSKGNPALYKIIFQASTEARHLDWNEYLKPLLGRLDPIRALQRIYARIVIDQTGRAYYSYKDGVNNVLKYAYDPDRPIFMCWDFNIASSAPIACVLFQEFANGEEIDVQVFDEFVIAGGNTQQACERFMLKYALKHRSEIWVWGDCSGENSQTVTEFKVIRDCLSDPAPHILARLAKVEPKVLQRPQQASFRGRLYIPTIKSNPPVEFRLAAVNAKLCNTHRKSTLFICPKNCPETIQDCRKVTTKPDGIDKSDIARTHCTDGLGYGIAKRFPPYDISPALSQYKAAV